MSCSACGSDRKKVFLERCVDIPHDCPGEWSLVECDKCGLVSLSPMPTLEQVKSFYPSDYPSFHVTRPLGGSPLGALLRRAAVLPYTMRYGTTGIECAPFGGGRLLEVGCGVGSFLRTLSDLGWKATGIDISPIAVEKARINVPAATIHIGTLEETPLDGHYDLIVMCHVLEHLDNPAKCLERCFELLAPSGVLLVCIPNLGSLESNLFSRRWIGLDVPRHLVHFREPVMRNLLERCGYAIEHVRPQFFASSLAESVIFLLPRWLRKKVLQSSIKRLFYLAMIFPVSLTYLFGNRSILEYRAKKPTQA
jgi:2-polyprenyl-3-methyl-5-hydroxy-6-metoxy-1,4-benzoquinol methylase